MRLKLASSLQISQLINSFSLSKISLVMLSGVGGVTMLPSDASIILGGVTSGASASGEVALPLDASNPCGIVGKTTSGGVTVPLLDSSDLKMICVIVGSVLAD